MAYERHKDYVLRVLAKRCPWIAPADRESFYHDAYALLLAKERADELDPSQMAGSQLRQYLLRTAVNKALDEGKSAERQRTEPLGDAALRRSEDGQPFEERADAELDSAPVRELVAELPERQQAIIRLRFFCDLGPGEIQSFLNISSRAYRKELERALRAISERYELVREGRWCESRRSLILAYVAGIAGPNRAKEARLHLSSCAACAMWAVELREQAERAAAVIPTPDVVLGDGALTRTVELASAVKEQVAGLTSGAKDQAAGLAARVDPSTGNYLAAARPGTLAAVVTGCMAVGGGATYCAVEGIPEPLKPSSEIRAAQIAPSSAGVKPTEGLQVPEDLSGTSAKPEPRPWDAAQVEAGAPPIDQGELGEPAQPSDSSPSGAQPGPSPAVPPPEPAQREFGFDGGGPTPSAAPASSSDSGAGGGSGGGGEFGP